MASLARRLTGRTDLEQRDSLSLPFQDFVDYFSYQNTAYPFLTYASQAPSDHERTVPTDFTGIIAQVFRSNAIIYALMQVRMSHFAEARFQYRQIRNGRPGNLFGTADLQILETPWPNGTTGDLLARMLQDADLSGNSYVVRQGDRLARLRPDWMTILLGSRTKRESWVPGDADTEPVAYIYKPGGRGSSEPEIVYPPSLVAHFAPMPDPLAVYRGMSWITPVIRETMSDNAATSHKLKFWENGATVNMVVKIPTENLELFDKIVSKFRQGHEGVNNAYKCLHPETEVAMWDGRRLRADAVVTGDVVVAWHDGRPVAGTVSATEMQPPSPIVTVTTERGRVIKTNDRHPFLTSSGWIEAANLKRGDLLTTGLGWASDDVEDSLTVRKAWMMGLLVGDGCFVSTTPVASVGDQGIRDRLGSIATLVHTGKGHDYRVKGIMPDVRAAGLFGKRSWEKRVPASVMCGSAKIRAAFISGLVDADGHVSDPELRNSAEVGITSTSEHLLRDVQHLLASLGVNASVSLSMPLVGGWRLCAFGNDQARQLAVLLNLAHPEKARRLNTYATLPSAQDRSRVDRVASVVLSAPEPTIGIEIAEYHTHLTGGVVTHNTLFLAAGADATPVGANLEQADFATVTAAGETRMAAAAGVPPILVGFSEGLKGSSLNAGNYATARRRFADGTIRMLWRQACGALSTIVKVPGNAELWYDTRDIAFLKDDEQAAAEIRQADASTIVQLFNAGYNPDTIIKAVTSGDFSVLVGSHNGMLPVQQHPATGGSTNGSGNGALPKQLVSGGTL